MHADRYIGSSHRLPISGHQLSSLVSKLFVPLVTGSETRVQPEAHFTPLHDVDLYGRHVRLTLCLHGFLFTG